MDVDTDFVDLNVDLSDIQRQVLHNPDLVAVILKQFNLFSREDREKVLQVINSLPNIGSMSKPQFDQFLQEVFANRATIIHQQFESTLLRGEGHFTVDIGGGMQRDINYTYAFSVIYFREFRPLSRLYLEDGDIHIRDDMYGLSYEIDNMYRSNEFSQFTIGDILSPKGKGMIWGLGRPASIIEIEDEKATKYIIFSDDGYITDFGTCGVDNIHIKKYETREDDRGLKAEMLVEEYWLNGDGTLYQKDRVDPVYVTYWEDGTVHEKVWYNYSEIYRGNKYGPGYIEYYPSGKVKTKIWYDGWGKIGKKDGPAFLTYINNPESRRDTIDKYGWFKHGKYVRGNLSRAILRDIDSKYVVNDEDIEDDWLSSDYE